MLHGGAARCGPQRVCRAGEGVEVQQQSKSTKEAAELISLGRAQDRTKGCAGCMKRQQAPAQRRHSGLIEPLEVSMLALHSEGLRSHATLHGVPALALCLGPS